ncbi:hypothetical protein L1765_06830 [Microaerobacter geothermalis]|uniref:hypothetical protein n=1 Tax=Microaerobacter geothermalis TaxID=674972 RepID=UPI001F429426|nr:hypothetical protein [Microaerobacter geothermalis]MCF6093702.1 hypothetical protein [Microaerobacter geothermalis]
MGRIWFNLTFIAVILFLVVLFKFFVKSIFLAIIISVIVALFYAFQFGKRKRNDS